MFQKLWQYHIVDNNKLLELFLKIQEILLLHDYVALNRVSYEISLILISFA